MELDVEERVKRAKELHGRGFNCCQSVFLAYSDVMGLDEDVAAKISLPFGGGMGGMRGVCGCVSATFMLTGLVKSFFRMGSVPALNMLRLLRV